MRTWGDKFIFRSQLSGTDSDDCGSKIGPVPGRGACGQENMVQTSKIRDGPKDKAKLLWCQHQSSPGWVWAACFFEHYKCELLNAMICAYSQALLFISPSWSSWIHACVCVCVCVCVRPHTGAHTRMYASERMCVRGKRAGKLYILAISHVGIGVPHVNNFLTKLNIPPVNKRVRRRLVSHLQLCIYVLYFHYLYITGCNELC